MFAARLKSCPETKLIPTVSIEEEGVGRGFEVAKVGEAYADEAVFLIGIEVDFREESESGGGEFFAGGRSSWRSEAAGEDAELRGFELENDGSRNTGFFAGGVPDFFGEAADHGLGFGEEDVGLEGVFGGDGLRGTVRLNGIVVDAAGKFVETHAVAAKALLESGEVEGSDVAYRADVDFCQAARGYFAHAGNALDRERREEVEDLGGPDDEEAVGLAPVGGDLGEELVGGYSGGGGEVLFGADLLANGLGDFGGSGKVGFIFGDVEIGFVEGERFDQVGVAEEDFADAAGDVAIAGEVGRDEDSIGTETFCLDRWHSRADAEFAGFVRGGADNGALAAPGDNNGLATKLRIIALLDGGVEGVHVDVDDLAGGHDPALEADNIIVAQATLVPGRRTRMPGGIED